MLGGSRIWCILAYLVGALADGSLYHHPAHYVYRVSYYQKSKQYLARCIEPRVSQLFGRVGHYYHDRRKDVYFYEVTSKAVYQVMQNAVGSFKDLVQPSVPRWILDGEQVVGRGFVRGFFDAEGYYFAAPAAADYRVRFGQSAHTVLADVRDILRREGFECSNVLGPYQSKPNVKPYFELHLHGRRQVQRFHELIRPCHPNKQSDSLR